MPKRKKRGALESSSGESDWPANLDDQLLLLAKRKKTSSQQSQPEGSRSTGGASRSDGGRTVHGKGSTRPRKTRPPKKAARKNRSTNIGADNKTKVSSSSELEEGEVSDSDDGSSARVGGSSNSSSCSSSSSHEEFRARRPQRTEEREEELVDRAWMTRGPQTRFRTKRLMLAQRYEQKRRKNERVASSTSSSDEAPVSSRRPGRRRVVGEQKGKFSKKVRSTKAGRQRKRKQPRKEKEEKKQKSRAGGEALVKASKKLRVSDVYSDDDGDGDSDRGDGQGGDTSVGDTSDRRQPFAPFSSRDEKEPQVAAEKEEIGKIRLTRHQLKPWICTPLFAEKVTGCFVRVRIRSRQGRALYKLMQVIGVVEPENVPTPGVAYTSLRLRQGNREKIRRLAAISNQEFTECEFQKWKNVTISKGVSLPSSEEVAKKAMDIQDTLNNEQPFLANPRNSAVETTQVTKQAEIAEVEGNREVENPAREVDQLEERPR